MAVKKKIAVCGNCLCRLGVTFEPEAIIPRLYCAGCEQFATHQEEIEQAEAARAILRPLGRDR